MEDRKMIIMAARYRLVRVALSTRRQRGVVPVDVNNGRWPAGHLALMCGNRSEDGDSASTAMESDSRGRSSSESERHNRVQLHLLFPIVQTVDGGTHDGKDAIYVQTTSRIKRIDKKEAHSPTESLLSIQKVEELKQRRRRFNGQETSDKYHRNKHPPNYLRSRKKTMTAQYYIYQIFKAN